jgi:hypothetical protein
MARFRCGNEERDQVLDARRGEKVQDVLRGERDDRAHVERMRRNEREGGKGAARNTERRRQGDRMDERDMEEKGKDREREGGKKIEDIMLFQLLPP